MHNASRVIQHYYVGCLVRSGKSWGLQSRTHNHCFRRHHSIPQAAPKPEPRASGGSLVWDSAPYTDKGKSEGGYALSLAGLVVSLARIIRICIIPAINRAAIARTTTCANKPISYFSVQQATRYDIIQEDRCFRSSSCLTRERGRKS